MRFSKRRNFADLQGCWGNPDDGNCPKTRPDYPNRPDYPKFGSQIVRKTVFSFEVPNYCFTKDLAQLPSLLLYLTLTLKLELGGLKLKKLQKYSEKQF